jgi:Bacterial SH3 domain
MAEMRRLAILLLLLSSSLFFDSSVVLAAAIKATIQVTSANLRAGPSLNEPSKAILKQGDQLTVESEAGDWYLVATPDGQKGYVHRSVVKLAAVELLPILEKSPEPRSSVGEPNKPPQPAPAESPAPPLPRSKAADSVTRPAEQKGSPAESPPLIRLLEGHETDVLVWAGIAVAFFFVGWICGGNYYLRRERLRRTKLRF